MNEIQEQIKKYIQVIKKLQIIKYIESEIKKESDMEINSDQIEDKYSQLSQSKFELQKFLQIQKVRNPHFSAINCLTKDFLNSILSNSNLDIVNLNPNLIVNKAFDTAKVFFNKVAIDYFEDEDFEEIDMEINPDQNQIEDKYSQLSQSKFELEKLVENFFQIEKLQNSPYIDIKKTTQASMIDCSAIHCLAQEFLNSILSNSNLDIVNLNPNLIVNKAFDTAKVFFNKMEIDYFEHEDFEEAEVVTGLEQKFKQAMNEEAN